MQLQDLIGRRTQDACALLQKENIPFIVETYVSEKQKKADACLVIRATKLPDGTVSLVQGNFLLEAGIMKTEE